MNKYEGVHDLAWTAKYLLSVNVCCVKAAINFEWLAEHLNALNIFGMF